MRNFNPPHDLFITWGYNRTSIRVIVPMLIRTFIGLFFSYYLPELIFGNVAPPEFQQNAIDHYINVFLHGILET